MPFPKGVSGNPKGRPKKNRTLATAIESVGNVKGDDGLTNKRRLSNMLWEIVSTKKYDNSPVPLDQWMEIVKWFGQHIDGPVPQQLDVENGGGVVLRVIYENSRTNNTPETTS